MSSESRFVLGTAQFGMNYGVNSEGRPSTREIGEILREAHSGGVGLIDTADAYGDSQEQLSGFDLQDFQLMSKFILDDEDNLTSCLMRTLQRLKMKSLFSYSFHRFEQFAGFKAWSEVAVLKEKGLIQKLGVSVYSAEELEFAARSSHVDLIQTPFNVFDRGRLRLRGLKIAAENGKIVHVRSVFLQGLFFKDPQTLGGPLKALKEPLEKLRGLSQDSGLSLEELCLGYVLAHPEIQGVVIGVDNLRQLQKNLTSLKSARISAEMKREIELISVVDQTMLNPGNWGRA